MKVKANFAKEITEHWFLKNNKIFGHRSKTLIQGITKIKNSNFPPQVKASKCRFYPETFFQNLKSVLMY